MSRLVIVSNRVANLRASSQSGGLAVGLSDALRERGGVWFGWDGNTSDSGDQTELDFDQIGKVRVISAPLTSSDVNEYYNGFSNSVLWPLFHYRLDLVDYHPDYFRGYQRVNERFAKLLEPELEPDDVVWVHDYHLIPLGRALRRMGCRNRIGFFLHIPFPSPELFSASPHHKKLVNDLLHYDLVGFQTSTDSNNLIQYLHQKNIAHGTTDNVFAHEFGKTRISRFPIGIDVESFRKMAESPTEDIRIDAMRRSILGRKQIIGVDRLDYSKGLPQRLHAFRRLLQLHPQLEKLVSLLQIAPPTRENVDAYADIRKQLEGLTGEINGELADFNWTPIRYIHRSISREILALLFRTSQVCLVTPLRDGMNLIAKEYVAAQDDSDPGVLVLSQFAGAAEDMKEALIVNPYNIDDMAEKLHNALAMDIEERRERHAALLATIRERDAKWWLNSFLSALESEDISREGETENPASEAPIRPGSHMSITMRPMTDTAPGFGIAPYIQSTSFK